MSARETWIQWLGNLTGVTYKFFVGQPKNEEEAIRFKQEQQQYGDIVQLPSADVYDALTAKTIELLKYMDTEVKQPNYDFLMKVDDDTFVRPDRLASFLSEITPSKAYVGHFH